MKVTTYNGVLTDRKNVRRIKGDYYKHSDILTIEDVRYRCTHPRIIREMSTNTLYAAEDFPYSKLTAMHININKKNEILYEKIAISEINNHLNVLACTHGATTLYLASDDTINKLKTTTFLHKNEKTGVYFVKTPDMSQDLYEHLEQLARDYQGFMYDSLQYSMINNEKFFVNHKYKPKSNLKLDSLMGDLTFGVEFETSSGKIPHQNLLKLGVAPLRDGSIAGYEYTTIPLRSIDHLKDITDELKQQCIVTFRDSLHIHIGGTPRSKEFLLKAFRLSQKLQGEFYKMVPSYKLKDEHRIKRRDRNYTNPLPQINITNPTALSEIINFLSDGNESSSSIQKRPHPSDKSGRHKWQIQNRYTSINFVNYIYSKSGTIEFRLHQGTINAYKTIYWLLINTALVKYAEKNTVDHIENDSIDLSLVLNTIYKDNTEVLNALLKYIEDTTVYFKNYNEGDIHFEKDSIEDREFNPTLKLW
ncbi:MAG: amidoligase family protein [Chlamydiia bacterium]|nr:amidoligase family protein [Chlamydiia bacterium]